MLDVIQVVVGGEQCAVGQVQVQALEIGGELRLEFVAHGEHVGIALLTAVGAVIEPLVGHVGMVKVDNRAIAHRCEHVVTLLRAMGAAQQRLIGGIVARGTHQTRHRSTGAGAVGDNLLGISQHHVIKLAQVPYGGLQVQYGGRSTTRVDGQSLLDAGLLVGSGGNHRRVAATAAGDGDHIALLQCPARGIAGLGLLGWRCHIAAHVGAQQYRRLLRRSLGHIHVNGLIGGVLHVGHEEHALIGRVVHFLAIGHRQRPCLADGRVKLQLRRRFHHLGLSTCASHYGKRQHPCQYPFHVILELITCSKSNQKNDIGGSVNCHFFHFPDTDRESLYLYV